MRVYYAEYNSPIGPITLITTDKGLCFVQFGNVSDVLPVAEKWRSKHSLRGTLIEDCVALSDVIQQLDEYFSGKREKMEVTFELFGTPFQRRVWHALEHIPYGETRSYKEIAAAAGSQKAVRAVGSANNKNPLSIFIPCHRVIGSNGKLVGYGGGLDKKIALLRLEGAWG
ncbi:methylated-DNA--[protein]-cysteine S-methyltransferase [Bacillus piscicola]|uniref:methylated-DNA--[protein]-cysteine S-methyltransferase n=1 Tax=Bacillus piscicola TaxID=1632684 RepID=UPI001F091A20|nr:methylated-DNA--[protein]-cysteine S-methyltransferase [Bacillus piscicola]